MASFAAELEQSLHRALLSANEQRHEFATLEHLLLALCDDNDARAVLRACNVEIDQLRQQLASYLEEDLASLTIADEEEQQLEEDIQITQDDDHGSLQRGGSHQIERSR